MRVILFLSILFISLPLSAGANLLEWHTTNVQILRGKGFELGDDIMGIATLEHANGWKYGDNFLFIDYFIDDPNQSYGEFSPRLSFSKITGEDFSYGLIQDVLLSFTYEKGVDFDALLYGAAVDLNIPGFALAQLNAYARDNTSFSDDFGWQITGVWSRPFDLGNTKWVFEGYFDYAEFENRSGVRNFLTQPQLNLDLGHALGYEEGHLYTGVEIQYWDNKFGIDGIEEFAPQALIKYVF